MLRDKNEAKDRVTVEIDYDRPVFIFPDLSSEQGNPMEYFKLAKNTLKSSGFYKEAEELMGFRYTEYKSHFNTIAYFLDFKHSRQVKEDDEYVYVKIKKSTKLTEQPRVFSQKSFSDIEALIEENHDFSLKNCYGRNHLYYLEDFNAIQSLVELNKEKKWFNLFDLDNFNSTILHGNRSFKIFAYLLNEMHLESPSMAKTFLYGTNVFNNNAFGEVLERCDVVLSPKSKIQPSDEFIFQLGELLSVIGRVDSSKRDEFLLTIKEVSRVNPWFKEEKNKKALLTMVLNGILPLKDDDHQCVSKKMKI